MSTKFPLTANVNINNDFGLPVSDTKYSATLSATTDTALTVPLSAPIGGSNVATQHTLMAIIRCSAGKNVWVALNATAAVPAGATFAATTSTLIPPNGLGIQVNSGDTLHFYTGDSSASVSVEFYWLS